ncbi:MAG: hypothetical protein QGH33_08525 [Pirellulaceae bacterium]|jgi:hypothetical protein|nr:hypothetical protein [Pirellulaceae bacterium]MDP7304637.1 hypothetical protein [Pirellulaceae bacterium]
METAEQKIDREPVAVGEVLKVLISKQEAVYPAIEIKVTENQAGKEDIVFADRNGFQLQKSTPRELTWSGRYFSPRSSG